MLSLLSVGIFSCEGDNINPSETPLQGTWHIEWEINEDVLKGEISFDGSSALVTAFGEDTSPLLNHLEEARFSYQLEGEKLMLVNRTSMLKMEYEIMSHDYALWELRYLDDIEIRLRRK